ncbi:MAG TPA: 1-acyl-sn-glycerol-3-phosphate acyltransferase [Gemmatimonadales bacterium]|nr:1-acyl-sn-glycerol-3-phosphate acyltransferase [Gemmatimonadales bacterium]
MAKPWLLPLLGPLARLVTNMYYRVTVAGPAAPANDPLLLVANHPNMVFDPALVATAVRRPVRFLAKAPLFRLPIVGRLLEWAGCLPVYRAKDDPSLTGQNLNIFAAVADALGEGAAVAIFPEGTSHDAPALAPLKTGAARLALGAGARGIPLAIVPVGLVMAHRDRARSEALVVLGEPIDWNDLRGESTESVVAVQELTRRITRALAGVTMNLDQWADEPLVTTSEAIYATMREVPPDPADRVRRLWRATGLLRALRQAEDPRYPPLAAALASHGGRLARLGLHPADLNESTDFESALRWTGRRLPLIAAGGMALLGLLLVTGPMILADVATRRAAGGQESHATRHLFVGAALVVFWWLALAAVGWMVGGWKVAVLLALALPVIGLTGLAVQQAWADRLHQARRWLLLRFGAERRRRLVEAQNAIALQLDDVLARPPLEASRVAP